MDKRLIGKVIVVSGGTKGVGRAAAEEFAKQGAKVVIGGRDKESALKSIRLMKTMGSDGIFVYTDLHKVEDCRKLMDEAYKKYGKIDGFFNYAGITPVSPLDSVDEETFDDVMDLNFKACFFCCQQAIKYMRLNGGGSIVLTGSLHGLSGGQKDRAVYACSKGVLLTLMDHMAHQYASEFIRCNYLTLGWVPTEGELALRKSQGLNEAEFRKSAAACIPMARMCEKYDYLGALVYMMSDESSMMTGSTFVISGGLYV